MDASVLFNNIASALLLPPLNLVLLALLGLLLARRRPRLGHALAMAALALLLFFSTGFGARLLVGPLERMHVPLERPVEASRAAGAIVVLSGGRLENLAEYGGRDLPAYTALLRVHYAVRLHRETGLPILVSGGTPDGAASSHAAVIAAALRDEYRVPVRWLEERSVNTAQNARYTAAMLEPEGVRRILLVTDAIHMPRAVAIFEKSGLEVIPAPTAALSAGRLRGDDFIPRGAALRDAHYALHEWIGMLWYRLRY